MFCVHCGNEIEDTAQVCKWCGQEVEKRGEGAADSATVHMEAGMPKNVQTEEGAQTADSGWTAGNAQSAQAAQPKHTAQVTKEKMMAALGVELCVIGAGAYWLGIINEMVAFLLIGYVLLKEKDVWLRAVALKSAALIVGFGLLTAAVSVLRDSVDGMYSMVYILSTVSVGSNAMYRLCTLLNTIIEIVKDILLFVCGCQALHYKNVKIGFLDQFVNKIIQL